MGLYRHTQVLAQLYLTTQTENSDEDRHFQMEFLTQVKAQNLLSQFKLLHPHTSRQGNR